MVCFAMLRYNGNTTNMKVHITRHHPTTWSESDESECTSHSAKKRKHEAKHEQGGGQLTLSDAFKHKLPRNSVRYKCITQWIGKFIAVDLRPFSIVDNVGFKGLLEPKYEIPSRTHFTKSVIPQLYEQTKSEVVSEIKNASSVAITTDGWTSRATEAYITVTGHFIDENWELCNRVLQTRPIYEAHTGKNIAEVLKAVVAEWQLDRPEGVYCVTDNVSNMDIAVREADLHHVKCFAHTVNLATQRGLQVDIVAKLLARVRKVIGFFHRSTTAHAIFKEKQTMLQLPKHALIQDVSTRWNSSYDMLDRFLEQQPALLSALMCKEIRKTEKDMGISDSEVSNAEDLISVLKPMKTITTILCEEAMPTVSLIFPLKQQIIRFMETKNTDSVLIQRVKHAISNDIQKRYLHDEDFLMMVSVLDPRFRSLPHVSDGKRHEIYSSLVNKTVETAGPQLKVAVKVEATDLENTTLTSDTEHDVPDEPERLTLPFQPEGNQLQQDMTESTAPDEPSTSQHSSVDTGQVACGRSAMQDLFQDVFITSVVKGDQGKSVFSKVEEEVKAYLAEECCSLHSNPLQWWKLHESRLSSLAVMAKLYLCIPGTSVPSERIFSTAGDIVTAQRATLNVESVDKLIFLKKNMKL